MYLNLWVYLFVLVFVVEMFFRLAVFSGNLLAGNVHSSMALDRYVQVCQWTGIISLLTWALLWASTCSLEACGEILGFLLVVNYSSELIFVITIFSDTVLHIEQLITYLMVSHYYLQHHHIISGKFQSLHYFFAVSFIPETNYVNDVLTGIWLNNDLLAQ